jgi:hypothetical protein
MQGFKSAKFLLILLGWPMLAGAAAEVVLVVPDGVTRKGIAEWREAGFKGVAVVLDLDKDFRKPCEAITKTGFELYGWVEVGRNPAMAEAHPEWMGSIGMHPDWQKRFPQARVPKENEVAKAYPWVPITGEEAFAAHLARIKKLLEALPPDFAGVFLNDLQGPPSSCGCGNLQCRWAVDYHVPGTTKHSSPDSAAARFVAEVQKLAPGKQVIPVWTTECEEQDMPAPKGSTGYCGDVRCATGSCPKEFVKQWDGLRKTQQGPIALLTVHAEFQRAPKWIEDSVNYLGNRIERRHLWLVVQGGKDEQRTRDIAGNLGPAGVVVARTHIDQSYSPKVMPAK